METLRFTRPELDGVYLYAELRGDPRSPCVVLLHGGGANLHWWDEIAPSLAERFRVVCLDFRGHGDSDHPEQLLVGAFHRDLEALVAELGTDDLALIGHSMGGHIALDYAARHANVWGLVAIEVSFGAATRERRRTRLALSLRRSYATRDEAVARYRLMPSTPGVSERVREALAEHSIRALPDGRFVYKFDPRWFALAPTPHERLEDVRCPSLVIRGDHSTLLTREGAESVVARLPSARLIEISGAGHNVHLERPIEVIVAITEHLSAHARAPAVAEIAAQSEEQTG
jgi:pimeloyl-ACP methyl ester carboxylesterase